MNNNIGDKPIYIPRAELSKGAPKPPVCDCPECEKTFSPEETDLRKDPRELQGRSQVKQSQTAKSLGGTAIAKELSYLLENGKFLEEFQQQYYTTALEKGFSPEVAEEKAELALLGLLENFYEE